MTPMKPFNAFCIVMALGLFSSMTRANAEEPIDLFPSEPAVYIPKPIPKPVQMVNLHCWGFYGDMSEVPSWISVGGEFERVLGQCGSRLPKADCEAAAAAVNDFRPIIRDEGLVGFRLFFAACSERQPFTMI